MIEKCTTLTHYRSLSSVGRTLLPKAERMHREGMTWRQIARDLRISHSALFIWRKLEDSAQVGEEP